MEALEVLKNEDFIRVLSAKGKVMLVGGIVRDHFLGKNSKDVDLLVLNIPTEKIIGLISSFGKVDEVGKSFGILKFIPHYWKGEPIDIAIPRTEKKIGKGYQGFEINADPNLSPADDLFRRDFTINAIGMYLDGEIFDPYYGIQDLHNKVIRMVNPSAFNEDPLRMLRAIQFSSRFSFNIEPETLRSIKESCDLIKEITKERIVIELDKIFSKGNHSSGALLLQTTGLFESIFGFPFYGSFRQFQTRSDFYFNLLWNMGTKKSSKIFTEDLKGDIGTGKGIEAIEMILANENAISEDPIIPELRMLLFKAYKKSHTILESSLFNLDPKIQNCIQDFIDKKYPISYKELKINGDDLISLGFKGKEIGEVLEKCLIEIYEDFIPNEKSSLLDFVKIILRTKI